ncbi:hypothetical protein [Gluconacetobacter takamatsuzukensis]|uniref:Uncharacterized protein n=1 Tax=Gluconacetobacter takamatsuzukensis TaxID=1286190 RepID=A0A7W4KEZ0_9PROT|nr:hypothetical protein [Gluconacetobacter takamatsuzukensis]MBB2205605.1 hypothetical protein [Gluconacetobacter takamatsuzukensis]
MMRQHKELAEGETIPGETQDFGVEKLAGIQNRKTDGGILKDHERAAAPAPRPRGGRMGVAPLPDHGPHRVGKGR